MRKARPTILLMSLAWSGCGSDERASELPLVGPTLVPTQLVAERVDELGDTLGFFSASDLLPHPRGYLVIDGGNDRLVLLDRELVPTATVGSSGSGPGELEAPLTGVRTDGGFAVAELSNGRVSFFDFEGAFTRVVPLPAGYGDIAVEPGGGLLVASASTEAFLLRIDPDGEVAPFADRGVQRPRTLTSADVHRSDRVAVSHTGQVFVLDNTEGLLIAYDRDGRRLRSARLPGWIADAGRRRNREWRDVLARQGARMVGGDLVKTMRRQNDGRILLLFAADSAFGLLVEPETLTGQLLALPGRQGPWDPLLNAAAAVIEEDEITVLHSHGLARFRLAPGQ